MRWSWRRTHLLGAVALALLPLSFLLLRCATSPEIPFIVQSSRAPWITGARPVTALLQQWGRKTVPVDVFERALSIDEPGAPVYVDLRAMRRFRLFVNGQAAGAGPGEGSWRREARIEITPWLRTGENRIRVEVENPTGPPLLSLRVEGLDGPVVSDTAWTVVSDGAPLGAARVADDTLLSPEMFGVPTPVGVFESERDTVLLLFMLGVIGFFAARRLGETPWGRHLPAAGGAFLVVAWLALFAVSFREIPLSVGFDANHHLAYVGHLREHRALPLAGDGWSMYQPPLFYVASALVAGVSGGDESSLESLKLLPFLCGLGGVAVAFALARRLFPEDRRVAGFAALFAAVLPMNLYMSAYFSNEMPHAFLVGAALLATTAALLAGRTTLAQAAGVGALFGLAALTKFTALALVPVALLFLACKPPAVERAGLARGVRMAAVCAIAVLVVAGWLYARNWFELGRPVVGNWALDAPGQTWWQQPGFHTIAWYTGFGEALRHPYESGFHSFWDGIYSTFWGDGGIAGRVYPRHRHPHWNYEFMSLGYLLALPATALLLFGAARATWLGLNDGDPRRRAALSFLVTVAFTLGFSILAMTVQLPFFAQAKAFYGLAMGAPLALFFALGAARVDDLLRGPKRVFLRAVFYGWLFAMASVFYLSYWG